MKIELWLKNTSQPRVYEGVFNTYEEGVFFCINTPTKILKYPIADIFRVVEYTP